MDMNVSIFGYKITLEMLILIGVIYLILVGHTLCSCCNVPGIMEALTTMDGSGVNIDISGNVAAKKMLNTQVSAPVAAAAKVSAASKKEGFTGANTNYGQSSPYDLNNYTPVNTSSWMQPNMTVTSGQPLSAGVQSILNRPAQPVPLPEGEMLLFANTEFKPECCPNTYSTSQGCACMTTQQYNYLVKRGSNNVPYSEY
jgi:hypothetical protein